MESGIAELAERKQWRDAERQSMPNFTINHFDLNWMKEVSFHARSLSVSSSSCSSTPNSRALEDSPIAGYSPSYDRNACPMVENLLDERNPKSSDCVNLEKSTRETQQNTRPQNTEPFDQRVFFDGFRDYKSEARERGIGSSKNSLSQVDSTFTDESQSERNLSGIQGNVAPNGPSSSGTIKTNPEIFTEYDIGENGNVSIQWAFAPSRFSFSTKSDLSSSSKGLDKGLMQIKDIDNTHGLGLKITSTECAAFDAYDESDHVNSNGAVEAVSWGERRRKSTDDESLEASIASDHVSNDDQIDASLGHCVNLGLDMDQAVEVAVIQNTNLTFDFKLSNEEETPQKSLTLPQLHRLTLDDESKKSLSSDDLETLSSWSIYDGVSKDSQDDSSVDNLPDDVEPIQEQQFSNEQRTNQIELLSCAPKSVFGNGTLIWDENCTRNVFLTTRTSGSTQTSPFSYFESRSCERTFGEEQEGTRGITKGLGTSLEDGLLGASFKQDALHSQNSPMSQENESKKSHVSNVCEYPNKLAREIDLLRSLNHRHLEAFRVSDTEAAKCTRFPLASQGVSLSNLLEKFGPLSTSTTRSYLFQVLQGIAYLHEHHIIHGSISGTEILINDEGMIKLLISGVDKRVSSTSRAKQVLMSLASTQPRDCLNITTAQGFPIVSQNMPFFTAPEIYAGCYGRKCDIWSVGCVIFYMITASVPWKSLNILNTVQLLAYWKESSGCPPPFHNPKDGSHCHPKLRQIMCLCFERNPHERPSARRLLRRDFFAYPNEQEHYSARATESSDLKHHNAADSETNETRNLDKTLAALSPKIFTDTISLGSVPKLDRQERAMTPQPPSRLVSGPNTRRLPPSSGKKDKKRVGGVSLNNADVRHMPPLSLPSRKVRSHHKIDNTIQSTTDEQSKDFVLGNKAASHSTMVMFDLTYSNSNESEALPISIQPLDSDVTSPLSNCSSNGDSSVGHSSVSSLTVVTDHWPAWAKEKKLELEMWQKGRSQLLHANRQNSTSKVSKSWSKESTPGKGGQARSAPRAPSVQNENSIGKTKKPNPFARRTREMQ